MPCNSDYMEPTEKERKLQETAKLVVRFGADLNISVTRSTLDAANNIYCMYDLVPTLCRALTNMGPKKRDVYLYGDAKDKEKRRLAIWWEEHEEADQRRNAAEAAKQQEARLRREALAKLTPAERKALGLKK